MVFVLVEITGSKDILFLGFNCEMFKPRTEAAGSHQSLQAELILVSFSQQKLSAIIYECSVSIYHNEKI